MVYCLLFHQRTFLRSLDQQRCLSTRHDTDIPPLLGTYYVHSTYYVCTMVCFHGTRSGPEHQTHSHLHFPPSNVAASPSRARLVAELRAFPSDPEAAQDRLGARRAGDMLATAFLLLASPDPVRSPPFLDLVPFLINAIHRYVYTVHRNLLCTYIPT